MSDTKNSQRSVSIAKRVVMKYTNVNTSMMSENSGKEKKPNRTFKDQLPMRTIDLHHTSLPQTQISSLIQNTHNSPSKIKEHEKKFLRLTISPNAVKLNWMRKGNQICALVRKSFTSVNADIGTLKRIKLTSFDVNCVTEYTSNVLPPVAALNI